MKLGGTLQIGHLGHSPPSVPIRDHAGHATPAGSLGGVVYGDRPWRMRTARAALTTGLALGFQDALEPRDPPPVVTPERKEKSVRDRIVLYFHPQVPEATLVLIRSG
jgi:hypothetical protein